MFLTDARIENARNYLYHRQSDLSFTLSKAEIHQIVFIDNEEIIRQIPRSAIPSIRVKDISTKFEEQIDAMMLCAVIGVYLKRYQTSVFKSTAVALCTPTLSETARLIQYTTFNPGMELD